MLIVDDSGSQCCFQAVTPIPTNVRKRVGLPLTTR
ncbi:hypothetical protein Ga0074812_102282 [Parafrankia irregularis]|uniref:Uncharacterized protein n=1 Tax=Parafrankia irregularis TaxID=795642 RepID=A0A0S4QFK8_9ACTN|nr:hypothetical protein Ga0074812_102282 [Parafrankia irregularis]